MQIIGFVCNPLFDVTDTFSHRTLDRNEGLEVVVVGTPQCALLCHCLVGGQALRPEPREKAPHGRSKYIGRSNSGGRREEDKEGGRHEVVVATQNEEKVTDCLVNILGHIRMTSVPPS